MNVKSRSRGGVTITEAVAVLVLFLPILMTVFMVLVEGAQALIINQNLAQGAKQAARNLAVAYATNPGVATAANQVAGEPAYQYYAYDRVRISGVIAASSQFYSSGGTANGPPTWNLNSTPPTVTVYVKYVPNTALGVPVFPMFDPLHLTSNFKLASYATYRLE